MGMKKPFPTFGNGNGNEKLIPKLWERESEARIPKNGREREFPLTPGSKFSQLLWSGLTELPIPPPLTVSLTVKYPGFFEDFPTSFSEYFVVTFSINLLQPANMIHLV